MSRLALCVCWVSILLASCRDPEDAFRSQNGDGGVLPTGAGGSDAASAGGRGGAGNAGGDVCGLRGPGFVSLDPVRKLDVLFMIDNSGSMKEEQDNLRQNFKALIEVLRQIPGGLPDLHIGVISSDVGAGNVVIAGNPACSRPGGDRGRLQARAGCGLNEGVSFISVSDGGKSKNFQGEVEDVFGCIANLGVNGCGFEHQLQSVRLALSGPSQANNPGFLRPDAQLSIIMITDEDDCSAPFETQFFLDAVPDQHGSYRCNIAGHLCNGQSITPTLFSTPLRNCTVKPQGPLIPVEEITTFVKGLKPNGGVMVSLIAGVPSDPARANYQTIFKEVPGGPPALDIAPVCESSQGSAAPALRLQAFVNAFGENGTIESICSGDFRPALSRIGALVANRLVVGCLPGKVVDEDLTKVGIQPTCSVRERISEAGGLVEKNIPACAPNGPRPCWSVAQPGANGNACGPGAPLVQIERIDAAKPGTELSIQCRTCD